MVLHHNPQHTYMDQHGNIIIIVNKLGGYHHGRYRKCALLLQHYSVICSFLNKLKVKSLKYLLLQNIIAPCPWTCPFKFTLFVTSCADADVQLKVWSWSGEDESWTWFHILWKICVHFHFLLSRLTAKFSHRDNYDIFYIRAGRCNAD